MSPSEARRKLDDELLKLAKAELGISKGVRLFESSEGSLAPLTIADSRAAVERLNEAIAGPATSDAHLDEGIRQGASAAG
jgi:hypothetical protein